jgi:hypothetical protein
MVGTEVTHHNGSRLTWLGRLTQIGRTHRILEHVLYPVGKVIAVFSHVVLEHHFFHGSECLLEFIEVT